MAIAVDQPADRPGLLEEKHRLEAVPPRPDDLREPVQPGGVGGVPVAPGELAVDERLHRQVLRQAGFPHFQDQRDEAVEELRVRPPRRLRGIGRLQADRDRTEPQQPRPLVVTLRRRDVGQPAEVAGVCDPGIAADRLVFEGRRDRLDLLGLLPAAGVDVQLHGAEPESPGMGRIRGHRHDVIDPPATEHPPTAHQPVEHVATERVGPEKARPIPRCPLASAEWVEAPIPAPERPSHPVVASHEPLVEIGESPSQPGP